MSKFRCAIVAGIIALVGLASAASPDQVGDYAGTIKSKSLTETGVKTSTKQEMLLSIAADDSTTITIGGAVKMGGGIANGSTALLQWVEPTSSLFLGTLQFKNGKISGTFDGVVVGPPIAVSSGKIKLKKL